MAVIAEASAADSPENQLMTARMAWAWLWLKHRLAGTQLEPIAEHLRWIAGGRTRRRHPELAEIYFEPFLIERVLDEVLTLDSCCLDVGAHIGSTLAGMMRRAPRGTHFAFEPSLRKSAWLERRFRSVNVHNVALGEARGRVTFYEDRRRPGFSSLSPSEDASCDVYEVELARLDDLVPEGQRVDFVKVDVEGAELGVLRGGDELLRRERPTVLFESGPRGAERSGFPREELWGFFSERDYEVFLLREFLFNRGPLEFSDFERCHLYPFRAFNFLATPKSP